MQRFFLPLLGASALLFACEPDAPTTSPDEAAPTAAPASDETNNEPEAEPEPTPEEAAAARLAKRFADLEEAKTKEEARWTDELKADAKKLMETKFKNDAAALTAILASSHRNPENVARDGARHPAETIKFFGIKRNMTVVEMGPGGGWYTEILAPYLAAKGKLVVNNGDPNGPEDSGSTYYARRFQYFLDSNTDLYGKVIQERPKEDGSLNLGPEGSADVVFIVRGLHGIARRGELDKTLDVVSSTLKKGGTLAIVQHRAAEGADMTKTAEAGYLPQAWVIEQVEAKGFKLKGSSELNANANDTHDHPEGVWTLPPTLALGDKDADKYKAIGESDRMTLRFTKK